MASECKLCALLGATTCCIVENEDSKKAHVDLHARQLQLIEFVLEKPLVVPNGSDAIARNNTSIEIPRGRRTKSVLSFCRELVDSQGKNCGIKCSQCTISIKSKRNSRSYMAHSLINHSCSHLKKDLFACSHCDFKFVSKGAICSHLKYIHAVSSNSGNYVDMTSDYKNDILDMIKICFGKTTVKNLDVTTRTSSKLKRYLQKRDPLSNLAYDFTLKRQLGDRIQCQLCPRSIPCNCATSLLDHARWHLDEPFFICRLCPYTASTAGTIKEHLKSNHRVAQSKQNYKDVSNEYHDIISTMLKECFGERKSLIKHEVRTRQRQNQIRNRCGSNSLLAEREIRCAELAHKFHRSGKLQCRICREQVTLVSAKRTSYTYAPMQHSSSHFDKPLISCRRCSYSCATKAAIGFHVRTKHGIPVQNEFDDHTNNFHSDFMDMLSKCFNWDLEPSTSAGSSQASSGSQKSRWITISKAYGNDLKAARQILAHDLIRKHAMDGKMICRICDYVSSIERQTGNSVMTSVIFNHALAHLDSSCWPYRCRLCSHVVASRARISSHVRRCHEGKGANHFEDMSDKFHEDIMKIVSKCYDWSIEGGEGS